MSETPRTDAVWRSFGDDPHVLDDPLMLIAEMLERIAIALEADGE
jgi:hypothetical protein